MKVDPVFVEDVIRKRWNTKLDRTKKIGASEISFCPEKIVLARKYGESFKLNGKMLVGKILHEELQPYLIKKVFPYSIFSRPKYEVVVGHPLIEGWTLEGHVDCVLPKKYSGILEFKTTWSKHAFEFGDFLTEAYIRQANFYSSVLGLKHYHVMVVSLNFNDIASERFVTMISGETDKELFDDTIETANIIVSAVEQDIPLVGPKQGWECNYCPFFDRCPEWEMPLHKVKEKLPAPKSTITKLNDQQAVKVFEMLLKRGDIRYNRGNRRYEFNEPE